LARGTRTARPIVGVAIDRHAFRCSGRSRLWAGKRLDNREAERDDKNAAHFQSPGFSWLDCSLERKMAHLSGSLLPVDSQKLDAIWLRRVIRSDEGRARVAPLDRFFVIRFSSEWTIQILIA